MASVSGLSRDHRIRCRDRAVHAAKLALAHPAEVQYTEGGLRWDGIAHRRNSSHGQYPLNSDCSSFVTWCLWNALHLVYNIGDIVNGEGWHAGYTGTLRQHGKRVGDPSSALRGDLVHYGPGTGAHVAIVVRIENGHPMVISHGGRDGPFYLDFDYRDDVSHIRRYI
jgi:cell wall-associated NlpC family hydrolase